MVLPSTLKNVGEFAFLGCSGIKKLIIKDGATGYIGSQAFYRCTSLESAYIGKGITGLWSSSFNGTALVSVILPDTITSFGSYAFYMCTKLKAISIGTGVTSIGDQVFYGCSSLATVAVYATSVPTLGTNSFPSSAKVYVPSAKETTYEAATNWKTLGTSRILPQLSSSNLTISSNKVTACSSTSTVLVFPSGITSIQHSKYSSSWNILGVTNNTTVTTVILPNTVTAVGHYAFYGFKVLENVILSNSLQTTGTSSINSGATQASQAALKSIILPPSLTSLGHATFYRQYNFTSVLVCKDTVPTMATTGSVYNAFGDDTHSANLKIYVPKASLGLYQTATGWSRYSSKMVAV